MNQRNLRAAATGTGAWQTLFNLLVDHAVNRWRTEDSFTNVFCLYCGELQEIGHEPKHKLDCLHLMAKGMAGARDEYAAEGS